MIVGEYKSTCSYCGVGCGIIVTRQSNGKVSVRGDESHPVNKGKLCSKGMNLHYVVNKKDDRLLTPYMRGGKDHPLHPVEWPEAIEKVASSFKKMIKKYGPDSVGFYVSGQCLTEEYYVATKLAKGFWGTNNIDTNSRLCMSSAVVGYKMQLGEDAVPISYDDIELADCFFITGANPSWCHPILFQRLEEHKRKNPEVKVIVADPRRTQTCSIADIHLQIKPGSDVFLNHAIGRCLVESGLIDVDFIKKHTNGFEDYQKKVFELTLDESAEQCGVSIESIRLAASYIGHSKGFIPMWAMGLNQSVIGVNKNLSLINLSLITGKIGKPGSGPFSLTGQPNAMGGREVGGMCNLLPAHRNLADESHRLEVANFWGVDNIPEKPGFSATEMIDALNSGKMKAVWIICTNPLVSLPNSIQVENAMKKARMVVVQDISIRSDTVRYADVIFPAAGWLEKEGTMTNSERRVSYLDKVVEGPGEALSDYEIICRVARKMGYKGFNFRNSEEVFDEYKQLTKGTNIDISTLTYNHLKTKGSVQWPFSEEKQIGTTRLFEDFRFYTPDQKAQIFDVEAPNQSEAISDEFPFVLTTGRIRDQWHTMTKTGKVSRLNRHIPESFLQMNPADAEKLMLNDNDLIVVTGRRGMVKVPLQITDEIRAGVVFLPMHWGKILSQNDVRTNNITNVLIDPKSKEPDFKFSAVNVCKYQKPVERILIAGAGTAAFEFIRKFRVKNKEDQIIVLSKEKTAFYNRILLPEYISGVRKWEELMKASGNDWSSLNITVETGVSIESINAEDKIVFGSNRKQYAYDKLILATGSRSGTPPEEWRTLDRVFTIRNREDADRLMSEVKFCKNMLVVGGGLLGLEMASALMEIGLETTLVNRNPRLMDRQLDHESSQLLANLMQSKGLNIFFNDEIKNMSENRTSGKIEVVFRSGKRLDFDGIVFSIGTRPNIEYAKNILKCNRGIVVNEYLKTSNENIFAIGEIAEFKGKLYGIAAAAEQQAAVLSSFLNGNISGYYQGSVMMNILKVPDIDLCSIGLTSLSDENPEYEEIIFIDKTAHYYKKCIVKDDVLVGAILLGDKAEFAEYKNLISLQSELGSKRMKLLRAGKPLEQVIGKLVCSCNNVGEGNILKALKNGIAGFENVCAETGAGTGCGSCKPEVMKIVQEFDVPVLV